MTLSPRFRAGLAFALTFAAGAASMRAVEVLSLEAKPAPNEWNRAADELGLSAEQRRRVDSVFARYQASTDAVLISLAPRLAAVSDSIQADLDSVLTVEQSARLRRMQRPATYVVRRKTPGGSRVDTLRMPR